MCFSVNSSFVTGTHINNLEGQQERLFLLLFIGVSDWSFLMCAFLKVPRKQNSDCGKRQVSTKNRRKERETIDSKNLSDMYVQRLVF